MEVAATRGLVLTFPEYADAGERLAAAAGMASAAIAIHRFPDGESRVTLPAELPKRVVLCRTLDRPNEKLVELVIAAAQARTLGAERVDLVAPYLCYMRQDKAFHPGEAVSQRTIGRLLAAQFDGVLTVDPHLHRVHRLEDAVPTERSLALTATGPMAIYLARQEDAPFLVGPDEESEQWVAALAREAGLPFGVARKIRRGDLDVEVTLPDLALKDRHVVLVDDVASSGRTLAACARACQAHHPTAITALVTHALFCGDALDVMAAAGIDTVWSTDSIPHATNVIHLAPLLADALAGGEA